MDDLTEKSMIRGCGFTSTTSMTPARTFAAAVAIMNETQVLVTGGESVNGPASAELYDEAGNWIPSQMIRGRSFHTATLLKSGHVLVVGGDNLVDPSTAELYDPATNSWKAVFNTLRAPRIAHTATLLPDGRVLVAGGTGPDGSSSLSTATVFEPGNDPINGTWTQVGDMTDARAFHTATLLPTGLVMVAGGAPTAKAFLNTVELFDPATNTWSQTTSMNDARAQHTATLLHSNLSEIANDFMVLVAGGLGANPGGEPAALYSAEQYKPNPPVIERRPKSLPHDASSDGGSWTRVGSLNVSRMLHTATLLAPELVNLTFKVLVTGGPDPGDQMTDGRSTEVYDSTTGTWTITGNMHAIRSGHTAIALAGGGVLVAGGGDNTAELGTSCNASAQIVMSPIQAIDFGQVHAGTEENNASFLPTVENTGNAPLTVTATISGPDAALFGGGVPIAITVPPSTMNDPCVAGPSIFGTAQLQVFLQFNAWSPVARTCQATLTIHDSNATNASPGQTWVFPMAAEIAVFPSDISINIADPTFLGLVAVGDTEAGELFIDIGSRPSEAYSAIIRFPPPPLNGPFQWTAGDQIVNVGGPGVAFEIDFTPRAVGTVTHILELISNAAGSPHQVLLRGTGKKEIIP